MTCERNSRPVADRVRIRHDGGQVLPDGGGHTLAEHSWKVLSDKLGGG
jgi:hypothetical protein